jgi:hypothetical protein
MTGTYATEAAAFAAVEKVKRTLRWWPGVIFHADGSFSLTCDVRAGEPS